MVPSVFALLVCIAGFMTSRAGALRWQVALCLFGGTAALSLPALGGAVITPSVLFLPFLIYRALGQRDRSRSWRVSPAAMWLSFAVLWGVLGAFCFPRMMAGMLQILTIDRTSSIEEGAALIPLRPVSGNITQSAYALGNVATFLAIRTLLAPSTRLELFRDAALFLTALNCTAAIINLAEFHAGLPPLLEYVRTGYATFGTYEAAGLVRIHGTFPETSAFSSFTLPLFAFAVNLWLDNARPLYSGALAAASLLFLLISTSGTAYVGLGVYLSILLYTVARRATRQQAARRTAGLVTVGLCVIAIVASAFVFESAVVSRVYSFIDGMVLSKMDSESGVTRSSWNHQAWLNFIESYGLGVGLGSARASSFALVLLSNVGAFGTACYVAFLYCVMHRRGFEGGSVTRASRHAVVASLVTACVSGTVFDLGIAFYAFAAAATVGVTAETAAGLAPAQAAPSANSTLHC